MAIVGRITGRAGWERSGAEDDGKRADCGSERDWRTGTTDNFGSRKTGSMSGSA